MWIHSIFLRFCGRAHRARSSAKPVAALRVDKPVPLLTSAFCTPYSSLITSKLLWQELSYAKVLLQRCEPELSLHSVCVCRLEMHRFLVLQNSQSKQRFFLSS